MKAEVKVASMVISLAVVCAPAHAHVKWFAPYIVGAPPRPIGETLANSWFWLAIVLVLVFFFAARALESVVYGISAGDPLTIGSVALGLAAVAFVATLAPAYRASRVDPLLVLRSS